MSKSTKERTSKTAQKQKVHPPTIPPPPPPPPLPTTDDVSKATSISTSRQPLLESTTLKTVTSVNLGAKSHATSVPPGSPQSLIAYVHNLSPIKRNKKNTIDYTTLTLQSQQDSQAALCYSKSKRKILEEKETTRSPVKIMRFTMSPDKSKIVINDKTILSTPEDLEYNFQYSDPNNTPVTSIGTLSTEDDSLADGYITVCAKVIKKSPPKTIAVAHQPTKVNQVSELLILDNTGNIQLDLWNEQIPLAEENNAYRFTNLSTTYWNNVKKLTASYNTVIKQVQDVSLCALQPDEDIHVISTDEVIEIPSFFTVEDVQKYKVCCNCKRRIVQVQTDFVKCDHCFHMMRTSNCSAKICASVVILVEGERKFLTIFEDSLKLLFGEFDLETVDTCELSKKLLSLTNIKITYNDRNIITTLEI